MADIVIYCPNPIHQKAVVKYVDGEREEKVPAPKILFVCDPHSVGSFKIQCADNRCRRTTKGRGWYEIILNGTGGYTVKELPKKWHPIKPVPYVVEECA